MSDCEFDVDIESDDTYTEDEPSSPGCSNFQHSKAKKRAHHNALERKRRDHIKDSFLQLKNTLPRLRGEKIVSRAQILKETIKFVTHMQRRKAKDDAELEEIQRQNDDLENQIRMLEILRARKNMKNNIDNTSVPEDIDTDEDSDEDTDDEANSETNRRSLPSSRTPKRQKFNNY